MLSCLTDRSSFSLAILFANPIIVFWIVSDFLKLALFFLDSFFQLNLFETSTLSEPLILLSCLSRPRSSRMGKSSEDFLLSCSMRFSVLLPTFSIYPWSSMSSTLATSDVEGISSSALFSAMACRAVMSQSIPTGYIPRATPRKIFLSERIRPNGQFFLSNSLPPGQKMMVEFPGVGQIFPNSKKLLLKLAKIL